MAPAPDPVLQPRNQHGVPIAGDVMSIVVSLMATTVLSAFLFQRITAIKVWRRLPFVVWVVLAIFTDSYCFVFVTAILQQSFGVNSSSGMCSGAILLCLICYVSTKILIYLFLVEKAHIIRNTPKRRLKSKLYIFNSFGMLGLYTVVVILNFVFRIARLENGECVIGMRSIAMIPLISFDFVVNVYLTILFLIPLKNLYSFRNMPRTPSNIRLRNVAFRTFVGACCTLMSSIVNLTVLMVLDGEPGWVCLMCCNCDIFFSALVIQWVTFKDNAGSGSTLNSLTGGAPAADGGAAARRSSVMPLPVVYPSGSGSGSPTRTEAEMSLVNTARSSGDRSDSIAKIPSPPGVMVTTTIRHQSKPSGEPIGVNITDNGHLGVCGDLPHRMSYGTARMEAMIASQPTITGGEKKDLEA